MDNVILKITNVSKKYTLGQIGGTTLRDELQRFSAKLHHRDDPTKKIGVKDYNKGETFMALNGLSFEVRKGERVGIIGHNGAGKSTLLKLISRVTAPSSGSIEMDGRVASMLEVGTGFHPELTGRENVYMNGAILGMTKKEIDAKMENIIEFSECRQFIDTPVKRYSSGMYVKLAFSVAAHLDSEIMIMDEVLAVGDMAFQKKCLDKMSDVSKSYGRTILYVSHNMNTIRQLCDRCIVLSHGKIIFDGDAEKAIKVYSGDTGVSNKVLPLDSIQRKHESTLIKEGIKFTRFELADRDYSRYYVGEKMKFILSYASSKTLEDVGFRITVVFCDGNPVETTNTEKDYHIEKTEDGKFLFELDISTLAPGMYTVRISANAMNEYLNFGTFDVVDEGNIVFEIIPTSSFNKGMQWNSIWWGHNIASPLIVSVQ